MSEKSIQNACPALFKLNHSKQVPYYQLIHAWHYSLLQQEIPSWQEEVTKFHSNCDIPTTTYRVPFHN